MIAIYNDNTLRCPSCGGENLHHGEVTIYTRKEDAPITLVTTIENEFAVAETQVMPSGAVGNPSAHCHGLRISFYCEDCSSVADLTLAQHEGRSMMKWTEEPAQMELPLFSKAS